MFSRLPEAFALLGLIKRLWKEREEANSRVFPEPPFKVILTPDGNFAISQALSPQEGEDQDEWVALSTMLVSTVASIDVECSQVRDLSMVERQGLAMLNLTCIWRELDHMGAISHDNGRYTLHDLVLAVKIIETSVPRLLGSILRLKKRNSPMPL